MEYNVRCQIAVPEEVFVDYVLTEKLWLLKHFNDVNLLSKKSEFISKCRHENKLLIKSAEKG